MRILKFFKIFYSLNSVILSSSTFIYLVCFCFFIIFFIFSDFSKMNKEWIHVKTPYGSEVVDCIFVAVDRYIVSLDVTDRCCLWKTVLCWFALLRRFAWELAHMLFERWVQMSFSSLEGSCGGCELTRLGMFCRVDPRGLVHLSGLGNRWTHPRRSHSSVCSWSLTLPI